MMREKVGTCDHCGYLKRNCMCGRKRNTSGEVVMYSNYTDLRNSDDYAMVSRIQRTSKEERKIMEELNPVDGENLITFLKRNDTAEFELCKYAIHRHLFGTKKTWPCHTTTRYCLVCTLVQVVSVNRALWESMFKLKDMSKMKIQVNDLDNNQGQDLPKLALYEAA